MNEMPLKYLLFQILLKKLLKFDEKFDLNPIKQKIPLLLISLNLYQNWILKIILKMQLKYHKKFLEII